MYQNNRNTGFNDQDQVTNVRKVSIPCQYSDNDQQGVDDEKHGLSRSLPNVHHPIYKKHRSPLTLDLDCHQTEASSSSNAISTSTMTTQQTRKKNSLSIWRLQGANTPADDGTSATLQGEMQFGGSTDHRTRDGGIVLEPETSDQYGEIGHHPTEPTSMCCCFSIP
uniref:Uncharacterized protein n=1 Tax=Romanomermis culicivorax TaxID=13658 RepID=A0A915KY61_ROMCU